MIDFEAIEEMADRLRDVRVARGQVRCAPRNWPIELPFALAPRSWCSMPAPN